MVESFQSIQQKIEFVIDRMSINDPLRDELIIANMEYEKVIEEYELKFMG